MWVYQWQEEPATDSGGRQLHQVSGNTQVDDGCRLPPLKYKLNHFLNHTQPGLSTHTHTERYTLTNTCMQPSKHWRLFIHQTQTTLSSSLCSLSVS